MLTRKRNLSEAQRGDSPLSKKRSFNFVEKLEKSKYDTKWKRKPKLSGIIISINMGIKDLNLRTVAKKLKNTTFEPKKFVVCRVQLRNPRVTVAVYTTGRIHITQTYYN